MSPPAERTVLPEDCRGATPFIDTGAPAIRDLAAQLIEQLTGGAETPLRRAQACFRWVRDEIDYTFVPSRLRSSYIASHVLHAGHGFCVQKAMLLCALGRASGVPTAFVLSDLRDHSMPESLRAAIGTNLLRHGLNAFYLDGRWVKADATLSPRSVKSGRMGYRVVELDGTGDALLAATTEYGRPHAEYLAFHGLYADLDFDALVALFEATYAGADLEALRALGLDV